MSSDRPSADPSAAAETLGAAGVARLGAPLLDALEKHLPGARRHAEATGACAYTIAIELGRPTDEAELLREAAKLHDVGMVYVPVEVLRKPAGELDEDERGLLASHLEAAAKLIAGAAIHGEIADWILHTRERWDGTGPAGLRGEAIPFGARTIRVACAADLLRSSTDAAVTADALDAAAGTELDPAVVKAAVAVLARGAS